ncbi:MAG: DUF58 domain-containing protein [Lachnospiraceae bacterium]|nr:DUF58 domain-containing protein [Lachnospiraceae bacterium]
MTIGTLFFALLFLIGLVVSVFFLEFGTVAIMGMLTLMPLFMLIFLIFMRIRILVSVDSKNPVAEKDTMERPARAAITLSVENRCRLLPITKGIARVQYENYFSGEKGKLKIRFSVDAGRKRDRRIPVVMQHCGSVAIKVKKVRIYDYLSIFAWTVGKRYETQNILILPPLKEMYLGEDRWYNETNEDSDRFSLYKKGDDPSEIFNIREFTDGDKIQRIHWKLSSKTGSLMVKEGSLPRTKAVHIFVDLCVREAEKKKRGKKNGAKGESTLADLLVQGIYSISMFMIEHAIPQKYIWYDRKNEVVQERLVEQEEELLWMFQDLFRCRTTTDENELLQAYLAWEEGKPLESALYLTVADHGENHVDLENSGLIRERLEVIDLRGEEREDEE